MRRDVFQAIADPIRRDIIDLLVDDQLTVNEIAKEFEISRPAISKHIKILQECDLLIINQKGRERFCQIKPESLFEIAEWANRYRKLWEEKLDSFEKYLMKVKAQNQKN